MGFIQKKDEDKDYVDGIEVIGRGEGPDGDGEFEVELHEGLTAEDISGTTARREGELELTPDPELVASPEQLGEDAKGDALGDVEELVDAVDEDRDEDIDSDWDESDSNDESAGRKVLGGRHGLYVAGAVVAVIAAAIIGFFVGSGGFGAKGVSSALVDEGQLDTAVASWSYKGAAKDITVREAIESQYSLDQAKNEDDLYAVPSADVLLAYVRNQVLLHEAEVQGITVDDEELSATAMDTLGTSDFAEIAEKYLVDEDQAKEIVREQAAIKKLYGTVVKDAPTPPSAPEEPENGDASAATSAYAEYIIDLAGDEWDAEARTWKDEAGTYAQALAGTEFTGENATYEQAQSAYLAAYQAYATESSASTEEWTAYVNELFAGVDLKLYGIYA